MGWVLRIKSFKNMGVILIFKNPSFRGRGFTKKTINRGDYLKRGAWTVSRFMRGLSKKEGVVFLRGAIPQCTL